MYSELRDKLKRFDEEKRPWLFRFVDAQLKSWDARGENDRTLAFIVLTAFVFAVSMTVWVFLDCGNVFQGCLPEKLVYFSVATVTGFTLPFIRYISLSLLVAVIVFVTESIWYLTFVVRQHTHAHLTASILNLILAIVFAIPLLSSRIVRAQVAHLVSLFCPSYGHAAAGDTREYVWNGFCQPPFFFCEASGLKWKDMGVGATKPTRGTELENAALADALKTKQEFTQAEWDEDESSFGIESLTTGHFILVGDTYFRPYGEEEPQDNSEAIASSAALAPAHDVEGATCSQPLEQPLLSVN